MDWIEFEICNEECGSIKAIFRPECIVSAGHDSKGKAFILVSLGNGESDCIEVAEPYEQVKQKIMDADKVEYRNVVVEHFTREEYELLLNAVGFFEASCNDTKDNIEFAKRLEPLANLKNKLNKILKEKE